MQEMYVADINGRILTREELEEIHLKGDEEAKKMMEENNIPVPDMSFLEPEKI